jgi:cellulose synthase/poly-beta-1,6-N-acetylglucosamine synthase-like glycosyltransferase
VAILFFILVFLILHSYILYPVILWVLSLKSKPQYKQYQATDDLPNVSVIMAAHNEESVIEKKIESVFASNYPVGKIEVVVGSDSSTDTTNSIVKTLTSKYPQLSVVVFNTRQGKVSVMNDLINRVKSEIVISTDANVIFSPNTIFELVRYMKDSDVGLVDSRIINTGQKPTGISVQESTYIIHEAVVKYREGLLWGAMIGPFGGCYAIKREVFVKPPANSLVDDFYISMKVIEQGKKSISNFKAVVFEDVSNELMEEFRRKVRIAMGNFQNLSTFRKLLWPPSKPVAFAFLSHKVLRWLGPIFMILVFFINVPLSFSSQLFHILLIIQISLYCLPLIDFILKTINLHIIPLRFATHFFSMNLALLIGLIKYYRGVKSNVWQPTQRNQ